MNEPDGDRMLVLEELTAHQMKVIEELNGEVARQAERLRRAEKTLEAIAKRLVALEEGAPGDVPVTRPPHW